MQRVLLSAFAIAIWLAAAHAQEEPGELPPASLKAEHGDWQVHCGSDAEGAERCFMIQAVDVQDSGQRILTAVVLKPAEGAPVLRLTVPLGVLLPRGIGLGIDGAQLGEVGFLACFPEGCMTEVELVPEVIEAMKAGAEAVVTVHDMSDQPTGLPMSLSGFTAAYAAF